MGWSGGVAEGAHCFARLWVKVDFAVRSTCVLTAEIFTILKIYFLKINNDVEIAFSYIVGNSIGLMGKCR